MRARTAAAAPASKRISKTFQELGVYGMSAITAITVQNTLGVRGVYPLPPEATTEQIEAVGSDLGVDALKTGMLFSAEIIRTAAEQIRNFGWEKVVVDPVMIAKGGAELLRPEAVQALREELLPLAQIVTPNIPEAEVLSGMHIRSMHDRREAAKRILELGPKTVVIKGGHDEEGGVAESGGPRGIGGRLNEIGEDGKNRNSGGENAYGNSAGGSESSSGKGSTGRSFGKERSGQIVDLVYDGKDFKELTGKRVLTAHTHGTGCTFSAAIAAGLAKGLSAIEAITEGRAFIQAAIEDGLYLGHGHGPTNHWAYGRRQEVLR
ncbi:hydroxymethylpyrimidine/phosphomethylpyrimidine kinase [Paenibacillus sp. DMB20]|uniref:hydroxymethylpyrimidine/phosphomethylpyrimidine kinase n=1 Tax=Paenibacillus sp. DMB20 TaxID=1642570 RepID=UPI001F2062D3|nr:hydroxymethylpyrimidine/phosphomethylpyrimidine kinase [Paenibacillus sp. DMB20]